MNDLLKKTEEYVAAFNAKDIQAVGELLHDDFSLTDPGVTNLTPKQDVLDYIAGIFDSAPDVFSFEAKKIIVQGDISVIEFVLKINEDVIHGIDLITWNSGKLLNMVAHLTVQK